MTTSDLSTSRRGNRGRRGAARRLGTLVALCLAAVLAAAVAVVPVGLSAQGVPTWVPGVSDLSTPGQDAFDPHIVTTGDGTTVAVWSRFDGSKYVVQASERRPGGTWTVPIDVSAPSASADYPLSIAASNDGTTTAVWPHQGDTGFVVQAATRSPGGTWAEPVALSGPGPYSSVPQVASAADGATTVVWENFDEAKNKSNVQAATRGRDGSWTTPVNLSDPGFYDDASFAQVAVAADGTATAVWIHTYGALDAVQATTRSPGGRWTTPVDLFAAVYGHTFYPLRVATAADGTTTAIWVHGYGGNNVVQATTRSPAGSWTAPTDLSSPGPSSVFTEPQVATAVDEGTTTAVWGRWDGTNYVVAAATRGRSGSWTTLADLSAPGRDAVCPQVAAAADGTTTAVWSRFDGAHWVVQARIVDHDAPLIGAISIPATGTVNQSLLFQADAVDAWSNPTTITWGFGDGASGTGGSLTHAYASVGTYTVHVTATDAAGNTTSTTAGTVTITAAPPAPQITRFKLTRTTIYATHHPRATRAVISLTAPAKVVLTFKKPGTRAQRKTLRLDAGTTRVRLTTRLTRTARLKPGAYKVIAVATNAAGESAARTARLRVIR